MEWNLVCDRIALLSTVQVSCTAQCCTIDHTLSSGKLYHRYYTADI